MIKANVLDLLLHPLNRFVTSVTRPKITYNGPFTKAYPYLEIPAVEINGTEAPWAAAQGLQAAQEICSIEAPKADGGASDRRAIQRAAIPEGMTMPSPKQHGQDHSVQLEPDSAGQEKLLLAPTQP